jgi:hypothetical protein
MKLKFVLVSNNLIYCRQFKMCLLFDPYEFYWYLVTAIF